MNQALSVTIRFLFATLLLSAVSTAAINETYCSLQGYSGIINAPNAMIHPDGKMTFLYTNQTPPGLINRYKNRNFNNYLLTIGFLPFVEITGRFMNAYPKAGPRDLSADFKCGYSFSTISPWLPSIACGIQDISGGAVYLSTKYVVISEEIKRLRLSLGYGTGPSRMEGIFWGAELFLTPFFHLLFDNDGDQAAVALRLVTAQTFANIPFSTALMIKNVYREKTPLFTFSASMSCDLKYRDFPVTPLTFHRQKYISADTIVSPENTTSVSTSESISDQLIGYGLQNIAVETRIPTIAVCYENNRYGHNEMDALGIVLGTVATAMMADSSCDTVMVTVLRSRLPVLSIKVNKTDYIRFLKNGNASELCMKINRPVISIKPGLFKKKNNVTTGRIRCEVSPWLRYFLGTEVGAFDYQLSAAFDASLALWPGGSCAARTIVPVWNTVNLDEGHAFSPYRENLHLNSANLFQFVNFGHGLTTLLSAGLYTGLFNRKYFSIIDDLRFSDKSGFFRGGVQWGYFTREGYYRTTILPYVGFQLPMDLFCKITGGVFWEQDTGIDISLSRRFNDIDIMFFCKHTKNYFNNFDTFVGAQICLSLSPRKGLKPWYISVSGKDDWRTSLSTRVAEKARSNYISTSCGVIPARLLSLDSDYFNRDRLNRKYIQKNVHILRDIWIRYRLVE